VVEGIGRLGVENVYTSLTLSIVLLQVNAVDMVR
jgi:hypothetical protein